MSAAVEVAVAELRRAMSSSRWAAATLARSSRASYEDWEMTDPAGQPIDVVRGVRDDIRARVEKLVNELTGP